MSKIIIAGQELGPDLGSGYRHFGEFPFWNATTEYCFPVGGPCGPNGGAYSPEAKNKGKSRFARRPALKKLGDKPNKVDAVQAVVKKFILHHDGVSSSEICWNVLHNERGLSCHFLIDNDGTIYQTLDLALMGFHAAAFNVDSIGVEFCNRGIMDRPDFYAGKADPHFPAEPYKINGHTIRSFDFTEKQYTAFFNLSQVLVKLLPNLAMEYPRDPKDPSKAAWGTLGPVDAEGDSFPASSFAGFLGHYHCTTRKWDPGPFDFKKWIDKLRGQRVFPLRVPGVAGGPDDKPLIPEDAGVLAAAVQPDYDANELTAAGGFFPVGPWGVTRLWHGGVHLPAEAGAPVYAPFPGRVIAARTGGANATEIGSNNFVLMRHDLNIASQQVRVYSLYMHLADESGGESPDWMQKGSATQLDPEVGVDGYDEVVDAGAVIGHVGTVGPGDLSKPQIHFEIFSKKRWFDQKDVEDSPFELIDGAATGRFCDDPRISELIDKDKDGRLSRPELTEFYESTDKVELRNLITFHASEWAPDPDWAEELKGRPGEFQKKRGKGKSKNPKLDEDDEDLIIDELVAQQLTPFLWWTDAVARALDLPVGGKVYHYHPLRFIEYANGLHKDNAVKPTERAIDDNEDVKGESAFKAVEEVVVTDGHLKLENMVDGYEGDVPP